MQPSLLTLLALTCCAPPAGAVRDSYDISLQVDAEPSGDTHSSEAVTCAELSGESNIMLTANGLSNDFLKDKFAEVLRDKFSAKISNGKLKLKALVIWDSCFLKEALWNSNWQCTYSGTALNFVHAENFNYETRNATNPNGLNAVTPKAVWGPFSSDGVSFDDNLLSSDWAAGGDCEKDGMGLEPYWCEDFTAAFGELASDIEIESTPLSLLDKYASNVLKRLVAEVSRSKPTAGKPLEAAGWPQAWKDKLTEELNALPVHNGEDDYWKKELAGYDIVAFDGGNPDLHAFALKMLAPGFRSEVVSQAAAGQIVAIGRSAGAMALGQDILTYEPNPHSWGYLMGDNAAMTGMGLVGECTIRPHFNGKWTPAIRLARRELARSSDATVVPIKNGEGLICSNGFCEHYKLNRVLHFANFVSTCPYCQGITDASA